MKNDHYVFNNNHLHNIKNIFEDKTGTQLTQKKIGFVFNHKFAATVLAVVFCLSIGTPILAANMPAVYEMMYLVSPGMAQFFKPVQKSDEDNGIKMEVVSTYIRDNKADFYITMQDLTGNRIDSTSDLNDSYSIHSSFGSSASCQRVGYDDKTKTATFLISITEWGTQKIAGDKITFSVREIISNKKSYEDIKIPIDLSLIESAKNTKRVESTGGGGNDYKRYVVDGVATALTPSQPMNEFPVEGIDLTGIGYIDKKLHIQTAVHNNIEKDNHGYFYLKSADESIIEHDYSFNFRNQNQQHQETGQLSYYECVFSVPPEQLKNYTLYGSFFTSSLFTQGNWQVTFPLEQTK